MIGELVHDVVDECVWTAEHIHKAAAGVPFEVIDEMGYAAESFDEIRRLQNRSIAAVYGFVRQVNDRVGHLTGHLTTPRKKTAAKHKPTRHKHAS